MYVLYTLFSLTTFQINLLSKQFVQWDETLTKQEAAKQSKKLQDWRSIIK